MKKNILWASIRKLLRMGLLAYAFLLCSFSGITGVAITHAMGSACILLCRPTPTPTPASTPIPTSTPIPIPTQQAPAPTQAPKATLPPQAQPDPTKIVTPASTRIVGTPTPAILISTPVSATATTVAVTPNQTATGTDAIPANQQSQGTGDAGSNMLMLSLGVGTLVFLLSGAMIWLLWKRQRNQYEPVPQGMSRSAPVPRWISNREIQSNFEVSQYASSTVFNPAVYGVSGGAEVLPVLGNIQSMPTAEMAYASSNPHTMTTALPLPMLAMPSNNTVSYSQNSGLLSQLVDSPNLSLQLTEAGKSDNNGQILPLSVPLTALRDAPTISMSSSQLELAVDPPAIKDDPMLGAVMRQAQMGLFGLPGREKS